jgi:hypothetical protein
MERETVQTTTPTAEETEAAYGFIKKMIEGK